MVYTPYIGLFKPEKNIVIFTVNCSNKPLEWWWLNRRAPRYNQFGFLFSFYAVTGKTKYKTIIVVRMSHELHSNLWEKAFCFSDQFVPSVKFLVIQMSILLQLFSVTLPLPRIEFPIILPLPRIEFSIILPLPRTEPWLSIPQPNILLAEIFQPVIY